LALPHHRDEGFCNKFLKVGLGRRELAWFHGTEGKAGKLPHSSPTPGLEWGTACVSVRTGLWLSFHGDFSPIERQQGVMDDGTKLVSSIRSQPLDVSAIRTRLGDCL
jgi:hypothetical protein